MDFSPTSPALSSSPRTRHNESPYKHLSQSSPQYKEPPMPYKESSYHYSPPRQLQQNQQHLPQNHISTLSPQLREQIQQHQLKQQLLKDQIQGKGSPIQNNVPLYVNTDVRKQGELIKFIFNRERLGNHWRNFVMKRKILCKRGGMKCLL